MTPLQTERRRETRNEQDPVTRRPELTTLNLHTDLPPCARPPGPATRSRGAFFNPLYRASPEASTQVLLRDAPNRPPCRASSASPRRLSSLGSSLRRSDAPGIACRPAR